MSATAWPEKILRIFPGIIALALCSTEAFAQSAESQKSIEQLDQEAWIRSNRTISMEAGLLQQAYVEDDVSGAISDGILNRENGRIPTGAIILRWQGMPSSFPLWAQLRVGRSAGQTKYHGFLQQENVYIPYNNARTGNVMLDASSRLGFPFAIKRQWQIVPFADYTLRRWQRDLAQYSEIFHHRSASVGILLQSLPNSRWIIESEASLGRIYHARLTAPVFGFDAALSSGSLKRFKIGSDYSLNNQLAIGVHWTWMRYRYGKSEILAGLQEPNSQTNQNTLAVRALYRY